MCVVINYMCMFVRVSEYPFVCVRVYILSTVSVCVRVRACVYLYPL